MCRVAQTFAGTETRDERKHIPQLIQVTFQMRGAHIYILNRKSGYSFNPLMYELMKKKHLFLIQNNNLTNHSFLCLHLLCVERRIY